MILIDTSAWIDFFRGRGPLADRVDEALEQNLAAVCGPIMTELRRGLVSESEQKRVLPLLRGCHSIAQPPSLWDEAGDLGFALRRAGVTFKTVDLLIAVHALASGASLLTADKDFRMMVRAGVPLRIET